MQRVVVELVIAPTQEVAAAEPAEVRGSAVSSNAAYAALRRRDEEAQLQVPHVQRIALQ
jgi:hypothetical protein